MVNRKAKFNYNILEEYKAGIVLKGCEVKSIKSNEMSVDESYCLFINDELYIRGMYIKPYNMSREVIDPRRDRKLLLRKKELKKIKTILSDKGLTIVPLVITTDKLIKVIIGIGRGKKLWDKRESIKEKDIKRELSRLK